MQEAIERINRWIALNDPTVVLNLTHLNLKDLPSIPANCQILYCYYNQLTYLPELPNSIIHLHCYCNKLTSLPQLPNCNYLHCSHNQLTVLPDLPQCEFLYCYNNQLTYLPQLIKCRYLSCDSNKLTYLPQLPKLVYTMCHNNEYLYINKHHATKCNNIQKDTPNYNKFARVIQRNYKKYLRRKYFDTITPFLFNGPNKIVCLYIIS